MKVAWFSAGVSSFIASYLERERLDKIIYIDIDDQHPDSMRFVKDCEKIIGKEIEILKSSLGSVENAERMGGVMRISKNGWAPCTDFFKTPSTKGMGRKALRCGYHVYLGNGRRRTRSGISIKSVHAAV